MMNKFLTIALLLTSLPLMAQDRSDCSEVDIRDQHPALYEHFSTPRSQGSVGWCYAFVAADLLTAETGEAVSSFHIASLYNSSINRNFLFKFLRKKFNNEEDEVYESGFLPLAINTAVKNKNVCLEADVPFNETRRETNQLVDSLYEISQQVKSDNLSINATEDTLSTLNLSPQISERKLARSLKDDNINLTIEKLVTAQCRHKVSIPDLQTVMVTYWTHGKKRYYQHLNAALEAGKPVGLSYNSNFYTGKPGKGAHVSVITARRWKHGKCQYKVRNSWGKKCSYREGIECNQAEGAFWIDGRDLTEQRFSIHYLTKRGRFELPYSF